MKASSEFIVGKHGIGWIDSDFKKNFGDTEFSEKDGCPTFKKLPRYMTDSEIESEMRPGLCELGDILAFLKNPPEGTKDGYANIFYIKNSGFVVSVRWYAEGGECYVSCWDRGGRDWHDDYRVFSPATDATELGAQPSDTLTLETRVKVLEDIVEKMRKVLVSI